MYIDIKLKKALFSATKVTKSDILFSKSNQYAVLCFKQSKTNTEQTGVLIVLVVTGEKTYSIAALARFYILNSQPANTLLFRLWSGAFSCFSVVTALKKCLFLPGLK